MESSEKGQTTTSSNQASQQFSSSNQSAQVDLLPMFQTPLAVNWGSQNWLSADRNLAQTGMQVPVPVILGSHQFFSMVNPSIQIKPSYRSLTPMPTSVGLDQLSSTNRQVLGTQSSLNIRPSMSANLASHPSSSISKRPTQIRAPPKVQSIMPMNMGSQLSTNNRPAQLVLRQKVQSESFESVRSKLRESLASSLVMVSDQQNKEQIAEKSILGDASTTVAKVATPVGELNPEAKNTSSDKCAPETLISDGSAPKLEEVQSVASDTSSKENTTCSTVLTRSDAEKLQPNHISLQEEVPNDNTFVKDELLQGHGLCWVSDLDVETVDDLANHDRKRLKMANEQETADKETTVKNAEHLAFRIEAELFRLFGGVNKKYKEKGRSLLFNLKDRSNPELRERVLSGVIAPERLCTMTTEELASKELSQWRLAKAEELAQMVVLPDSDVDLRRLVKKTHKGEFQVEVEQAESFPVEVELGTSVLSQVPPKPNEEVKRQSKSNLKSDQPKASDRRSSARKIASGDQNLPADIEILHEKTDLMQELMVDEVKDPELLPPIVSLDEFMQALDSEPPFENLSVDSLQEVPSSGVEKLDSEPEKVPASDSVQHKQDVASGSLGSKSDSSLDGSSSKLGLSQDSMQPKLGFPDATLKDPATVIPDKVDMKCSRNDDNLNSGSVNIQSDTCPPEVVSSSDKIWEGLIQWNISAVATVIGFFRSGEKTSTQEWPSFLEIKGRVRLDAFEKFLKELPLSRSRAIMIAQFCWKDGSNEGGRLNLLEIIDSYVADERVGYAEPAPGVELYFCPRHSRMTEMLEKCLPKEHAETLQMTFDGLIGVVVWRRPHVMISPRMSSHHKHGSSKKQFSSRKQQSIGSYPASKSSVTTVPAGMPAANAQPPPEDDTDVPPGFGPRDDDDLPEFDFVHGSSRPSKRATSTRPHVLPARPVDQIRELIHKYGQSENVKKPSIDIQPWNDNDDDDEDDDIPEWRPQDDRQLQAQALPPLSLPPPPPSLPLPLPLPPQLHTYQQQTLQPLHINQQILSKPLHINQQILSMPPQHLSSHPQVPLQHPVPMAALPPMALQQPPLPPQIAVLPAPLNMPSPRWQQQSPLLPLAGGPVMQTSHYNAQPNVDGQMYSMPPLGAAQNVMGWRPDVFGNRGGS